MPTRLEWEASDCLQKRNIRSHSSTSQYTDRYTLCSPCDKRLEDSSHDVLCWGAELRCESMRDGEPTVEEAFAEFLDAVEPRKNCSADHIVRAIDLLGTCIGRCWECTECEYRERRDGRHAFLTSHGVSFIESEIPNFCSYFIIRKCLMSDSEKMRTYTVMSKLIDFLFSKKYIGEESKKELKRELTRCRGVKSEKIIEALERLRNERYWKSLEREGGEVDDHDGSSDSDSDGEFYKSVGGEMPMTVKQVTEGGWIFERPYDCGYRSGEDSVSDEVLLLRLPGDVAKLGRDGMDISCIALGFRNGVWHPYGVHGSDIICANVYP